MSEPVDAAELPLGTRALGLTGAARSPEPAAARRRRALLGLVGVAALLQALLLTSGFTKNPYVQSPVLDSAHFWDWGGRIAGGEWVQDHPYFGAPLFPHLVALVRALGGGLVALAVVHAALHVGTVVLIARSAGRLFGGAAAPVAGAVYLALSEPALGTGRVLGATLQLFLIALLLERCSAFNGRCRAAAVIGAAAGLLALAWPAFLLGLPVLALWCLATAGRTQGLLCLAASALAVLTATGHNLAASGEAIPISAHGGITFWHGNNPEADGVFAAVDVVNDKDTYHLDALEQARAALGQDANWGDASSFFFDKGLAWWAEAPGHALGVAVRKLRYYLTGSRYGDVYITSLERRDGLLSPVASALVPLAFLMPLSLAALFLLVGRRPLARAPLVVAALLPMVVCVAFWYTPRYRLPVAPAASLLAAFALLRVVRPDTKPAVKALLAGALLLGIAGPWINRATGFDDVTRFEAGYLTKTGSLLGQLGDHDRALDFYVRAAEANPEDAVTRKTAYDLLRHAGREADAVKLLEAAPQSTLADPGFRVFLAYCLATTPAAEVRDGKRALALAEGALGAGFDAYPTWEAIAVSRAALGEFEDARATVQGLRAALPAEEVATRAHLDALDKRFAANEPWVEPALPPLTGARD